MNVRIAVFVLALTYLELFPTDVVKNRLQWLTRSGSFKFDEHINVIFVLLRIGVESTYKCNIKCIYNGYNSVQIRIG